MCKQESHSDHNVMSLKVLLERLQHHQEEPMPAESFQEQIGAIETIRNEILYELRLCVENISEKFREIEKQLIDDFTKAKVELLEQVHFHY